MANDVNANIRVNLDTSQALAGLQSLQSRISSFNQSVIQSNAQAVAAQRNLLNNFQAQVGASRQFSTSITNVETSVGRLQTAIDKNRLSMGQYFRYGVASSKNFGKVFRQENEAITRLATERVQKLQTQYVALGQAQGGMTKALAVRPLQMFNADSAIAIQRSQIFNKLLQDGSTSLVNWGKNTQWAGRQLMVGFTVPLTIFGGMAAKTFMELEEQAISFRKVYGDIFTTEAEVEENLAAVRELTQEMTKYGIAAKETFELANVAAQSGARGADLMAQTRQATRLAVLGQMEQQEAIKTTITLQNAFQLSNEDLADSINFLNIVENQSVLSLQDVAGAIPRVAPVIKSLGGDVRDLSVMLVAMREGGVSAAEGANALKTSLARLISPTAGASKMAKELGINLNGIVEANQGDILGAVLQLAGAMEELDELSQQRLLSEIFGKRQYARVGALFNNITNEASQAQRVLDLTTMSTADLAATADKELGAVEESISTKFTAAVELLKTEIAPIGEQFLKLATPIVEAVGKIFAKFNDLSPTVKNFITILTAGVGVVVPIVLMLVGLFGNLLGNLAKGIATLSGFFQRIRNGAEAVQYLAGNQLEAEAAAASLEGRTSRLTGSLNVQREAVEALTRAYNQYVAGANAAASNLPQGFRGPTSAPQTLASGGMVGGVGNSDNQPALLTPGEFVMNKDATQRFGPILDAMNRGTITGLQEGSRLASTQFGEFQAQRVTSVAGVERLLSQLVNLSEADTSRVTQSLQQLEASNELTMKNVQSAIKDLGVGIKQLPDLMARSHVFEQPQESVSPAMVRQMVAESGSEITAPAFNQLLTQAEQLPAGTLSILPRSDLIADLPKEINEGLKRGVASTDFADALEQGGVDKWSKTVKLAGVNAEEAAPQFQKFDTRLKEIALSHQGLIGDADDASRGIRSFGSITKQAMDELEGEIPLVAQSFDTLENRFRTFQVSLNTDMIPTLERLGYVVESISRNGDDLYRISGAGMGAPVEVRRRAQRESARGAYRGVKQTESLSQYLGMSSVQAINRGTEAASESRAARRAADNVVEGFANQLKRGIPESQAAAQGLGEAASTSLASTTSDIRLLLKERLNVGPMVEAEQAQLRENVALEKQRNKEIERRMLLLQSRGASQFGLRERAERELAAERARPAATGGRRGFGLQVAPKSVQDDLIRATQQASKGMNNAAMQANQASRRFARLKGAATKFGGALKNGSMKMQGAFFALDGLVFAASMVNGSLGDMAQKILPVVFGLQGLTMVLPLLTNPIGLMIAAVGAAVAGLFILKSKYDESIQKQIEHSIALDGAATALDDFAEELGRVSPVDAFNQMLSGIVTKSQREVLEEGQGILEGEAGQAMLESVEGLSPEDRLASLRNQMNRLIAYGIFTTEDAIAVSRALGVTLRDPALGSALVENIYEGINSSQGLLRSAFDDTFDAILTDVEDSVNSFYSSLQEVSTEGVETQSTIPFGTSETLDQETEAIKQYVIADKDRAAAVATSINNSQKLAEAQAFLNTQYRKGAIDIDEYNEKTQTLSKAREAITGVFTTMREQADLSSAAISANLKTTALALGMTEEEFGNIETQVRAVEDVLGSAFQDLDIQPLSDALQVGLLSGDISEGEVAALTAAATGPLKDITEQLLSMEGAEAAIGPIADLISLLGTLPQSVQTDIIVGLETGQYDLDDIDRITLAATRFAGVPSLQAKAFQISMEGGSEEALTKAENFFNDIKNEPNLYANVDISGLDVNQIMNVSEEWDSLGEKKNISKIIKADDQFSDIADDFDLRMKELNALPNVFKQAVLLQLSIAATAEMDLGDALGKLETVRGKPGFGADERRYQAAVDDATARIQAAQDSINAAITEATPEDFDEEIEDGGGGGGGGAEESFLEGLINTFSANTKLFNTAEGAGKKYINARGKFFGMLEKLRKEGIPEGIIAMIGTGAKGVENAKELLDATAKERKQLLSLYGRVVAGEAADEIRVQQAQAQIEIDAASNLRGTNRSQEFTEFVMGNEKLVAAFAAQNRQTKEGRKTYWELVQLAEDLMNKEKDREEIQKSIADRLKDQADLQRQVTDAIFESMRLEESRIEQQKKIAFEQERGITPELLQHQIEMRNYEIQAVQDLIDEQQRSIDAEQARIDEISRAIEMKEREIAGLERQNELDERRIETLSRQDELRNREAEGLERELSLMSEAEQKIRDAYQKRIDALDKIASINDYIVNQQRQQLDLSRAISEGDIYSATAAIQEMRASSAGFAATQVRDGLEAGMEGQVAGLRTAGGLTREQAEERIRQIQEQSYQTSLKIRNIEDQIYARNQQMIPLKDEIYNMNQQILDIEDLIYQKEQAMQEIINLQLEPLETQNALEQGYLDLLEKEIKEETGPLAAKRQALERQVGLQQQTEDLNIEINRLQDEGIKKANRYANKWGAIASNAWSAANAAAQLAGAQLPSVNAYAGGMIEEFGMGGKIKKYRGGGVVSGMQALAYGGPVYGSGGRDTVPAMLMPGEFVVRKAMVEKYGEGLMRDINMGSFAMPSYEMEAEMGTPVVQSNNMISNINAPVYNSYDMKFAINGANQSADEIANTVMFKMRQLQNQGIRTNRGY